jgi:hypothetical protein
MGSPLFLYVTKGESVKRWRSWIFDPKLLLIGGMLLGIGLGVIAGWLLWPVSYYDTDVFDLRADYQDDFVVMVGALNTLDQDAAGSRQLLTLLSNPKSPRSVDSIVVDVTERYIALGANPIDVGYLVSLAKALGTLTTPMQPYLNKERP